MGNGPATGSSQQMSITDGLAEPKHLSRRNVTLPFIVSPGSVTRRRADIDRPAAAYKLHLADLTHREIAEKLGLRQGSIRVLLRRAQKLIEQQIILADGAVPEYHGPRDHTHPCFPLIIYTRMLAWKAHIK